MYISTISILLPIILGAVFFRNLTGPIKVLYAFIIACGIFELWSSILFFNGSNNLFLFPFQTIVEFIALSVVYYHIVPYKPYKMAVLIISTCFSAYLFWNVFNIDLSIFDSNSRVIESIILIGYFLAYMVLALQKFNAPYLEMNPYFILTAGFLIYFLGTVFTFLFSFQLDQNNFLPSWTVHSLLNIFLNLIYSTVIWRSKKV